MEKPKKWQFALILTVLLLTLYNILPTVIYYLQPLQSPVSEKQSIGISKSIEQRVNDLDRDTKKWLSSFCGLLHLKPQSIVSKDNQYHLEFIKSEDARDFRTFLPRAGSLISFPPMQLALAETGENTKHVIVQRALPLKIDSQLFSYAKKDSALYRETILDRAAQIVAAIGENNAFFSDVSIDWNQGKILLNSLKQKQGLINELAKIHRFTNEEIKEKEGQYYIDFHTLPNVSGLLVLDLHQIVQNQKTALLDALRSVWQPQHTDLKNMAIVEAEDFEKLPLERQALSLIIDAKAGHPLRLVAKGIDHLLKSYEGALDTEAGKVFSSDFKALVSQLKNRGFSGQMHPKGDIIFEQNDWVHLLLMATREDFQLKGSRKTAFLELSNGEQRLLAQNKIDNKIHEELLQWQSDYQNGKVSLQSYARFEVPKPTTSPFWNNLSLSIAKFFRGDERKILHWGLDLSGGKTVQIELRDANNQVVKNEEDVKQAMNELYKRVNKMGVSEVAIRQLGHCIVLDFPGCQSMSASELIKASSMYFHIVNEKFSLANPTLAQYVQRFLQEVWNEAVVTNQKSPENVNTIAIKQLHGEQISESAKVLLENGLKLQIDGASSDFSEEYSKIALMRGNEAIDEMRQANPLMIVFRNYVLEGSELDNVQSNYDPSKGNFLNFEVKNGKARRALKAWTSQYAKDNITGTEKGEFSHQNGWRMAVVLNDTVISAPSLQAVISDSASITGSFSKREVSQLTADLKAGSLSFTPHILSEKNVSPELGAKDRMQGIGATIVSLILIIGSMIAYYRFGGIVASVAVILNLLILWATLQNINATLSLAGIAGVILTVSMAVDANVLVFERIREEFAQHGKMGAAIAAGYKKAYSAIIDSNLTTIIAAFILMNFDAGPIKGFAVTLIIGIVSSMFTALFLTKYYFSIWVQNPHNKMLNMANWIRGRSFDFLKFAKPAFIGTSLLIVVGCSLVYWQRSTLFGMDFTGGFSVQMELAAQKENLRSEVESAFMAQGASHKDFQVRTLNPSHHLRVLFSTSMENPHKPFYNMSQEEGQNPRIQWIISALEAKGLAVANKEQLGHSWTKVSGQMSDNMRNNALFGLILSLICIFIYIAFRFEYKFAAAATLCLLHDVLITLGVMGCLHALGVPLQIDLNTVAALMTIIGYSLNDTIIIFDRIREEMQTSYSKPLTTIVNSALNATLSRTTITSGTTLLVLIALTFLGGPSIFSFALVMTIGVLFGTLSSWYIASPLMLLFHKKEGKIVEEIL